MNMYNLIIRPLLFCIDPEKVHRMLLSWLKFYRYLFPVRACVRGYSRVSDPFSYGHLQFKNRIGLSAGFDKNAEAFDELADFGFGFLEVGTVTPDSQSGNPSPRIFRLVDDESLISRTGFNNCGVDAVRQHIRKYRKHSYVLGVNINKNPLSTGDQIVKDFESTFIHLYDCVDYFTLNWGSIQSGSGDVSSADIALNEFMHNYLKEHYLFKDEYNTLEVDCKNVSYDNFLSTYLLKMKTNTEDGGISRAYSVNAGQRYIYSYIEKVGSSDTRATTRATSMVGTGLGTFFSSYMADRTTIGLSIGYVFVDSPAAKAGLRRGDVIVAVNGVTLNKNNYQQYMNALYYASGGESFNIGYRRYVPNEDLQKYELVDGSVILTTGTYNNNPVLYSMFIKEKEGNLNVAYLVYQGFDLNYAEELKYMIQQFKTEGITDLILDLRYNYGGAVELSRYLSASIAGSSHRSDVFMRMQRSSGADEYIRFGDGDDLGLNSIRIICSEETASSSELVISGLRGIDFPVKLFGSRTEGKNVGMEVQEYKYGNSYYEFAPITFRSFNAKDWGDYADGIEPDVMLNNQNADYTDDIDNAFPYAFGDWDNFDFNLPLWYALCDIQGVEPNTGKAKVRSGKMKMERPQMDGIQRLPSVSVKRSIGTFGSVIYNKPEVENLY